MTPTDLLLMGLVLTILMMVLYLKARKRKTEKPNHPITFSLRFIDLPHQGNETLFDMLIFQDQKFQSNIIGQIKQGAITRLTSSNDFIYEYYTTTELEEFIMILFKHHQEHPNEPLPYPLDHIKCYPLPLPL